MGGSEPGAASAVENTPDVAVATELSTETASVEVPDFVGDILEDFSAPGVQKVQAPPAPTPAPAPTSDGAVQTGQGAAQPQVTDPPPAAGQPPPVQAPPAPAAPQAAQAQPQAQTWQPPTREQILAHRENVRGQVENSIFQRLTPEDHAALVGPEPGRVIAKLASHLHMDMFDAVQTLLNQERMKLPQVIQEISTAVQAQTSSEEQFFREFPALNKPEYAQTVYQVARSFRQMNPRASAAEIGRMTGLTAMQLLGIQGPLAPPTQSASPVSSAPQPGRQAPYVPTAAGQPPRPALQQGQGDEWWDLVMHQDTF